MKKLRDPKGNVFLAYLPSLSWLLAPKNLALQLKSSSQVAVQLSSAVSGALATPDPQRQAQSAQSRPLGFSSRPRPGPLDPPLPCLPGCSALPPPHAPPPTSRLLLLVRLRPQPPNSTFRPAPGSLAPPPTPPLVSFALPLAPFLPPSLARALLESAGPRERSRV